MWHSPLYKKMLMGALLTVVAIACYPHLPQRHLHILPNPAVTPYLLADKAKGGVSQVSWVNEVQHHMICKIRPSKISPYCGMQIKLANSQGQGIDLSSFSAIKLKVYYKGSGKMLRFHLRNFDARFSKAGNTQSEKFQSYSMFTSETNHLVEIPMSAIAVADWWLQEYAIKREYAAVDIGNVTHIGIDMPSPIEDGEHEIRLDQLEFIGPWLSRAQWYGSLVACWIVAMVILLILDRREFLRRFAVDRLRLTEFTEHYSQGGAGSNLVLNAHNDHVTQLLNRSGLARGLWQLRQHKNQAPIALAFIDMDGFNILNRQLGHELGNELLRSIGEFIATCMGDNCLVARWGDDKFVLVLSHGTAVAYKERLQELRLAIARTPFILRGETIHLTASITAQLLKVSDKPAVVLETLLMAIAKLKSQGGNFFSAVG